ncbi:MAG: gluconate 2-dehydrogenase subunit 3 family protein, partial [Bacteroidota bacterium]
EATAVPFYRQLKELTVAGYYTSEVGATQELQWLAVPGRYDADVPLSAVGRAWA